MAELINEELEAAAWVVAQIEAATDATHLGDIQSRVSGAYLDIIPDHVILPAVRFHAQTRNDVRGSTNASHRIVTNILWLVVVVREGKGVAPIVPIANALDKRLHKAQGGTAAVDILGCVRIEPFTLFERAESGAEYRHAGGLYRTIVQAK